MKVETEMKHILFTIFPGILFGRYTAAILIAFASISLLYFQFQGTPAGADPEAATKIHQLQQMMPTQMMALNQTQLNSNQRSNSKNRTGYFTGQSALSIYLLLLEKGHTRFSHVPDYTATFLRRERLHGEMSVNQMINMKVRHEPFSVYMKWVAGSDGQEVIYVEGENNGNMIAHPGGWKSKLVASIEIDPHGSSAKKASRHPITRAGVLNLMEKLIKNRKRDLEQNLGSLSKMLDDQVINDRDCYCFVLNYSEEDRKKLPADEQYRKSIVYFDKEELLPIHITNYTWPTNEQKDADNLDELTLVEHYSYTNIKRNQNLTSKEFDQANSEYSFIRR